MRSGGGPSLHKGLSSASASLAGTITPSASDVLPAPPGPSVPEPDALPFLSLRVVNHVHTKKVHTQDKPPNQHEFQGSPGGMYLLRMYMIYYSYYVDLVTLGAHRGLQKYSNLYERELVAMVKKNKYHLHRRFIDGALKCIGTKFAYREGPKYRYIKDLEPYAEKGKRDFHLLLIQGKWYFNNPKGSHDYMDNAIIRFESIRTHDVLSW